MVRGNLARSLIAMCLFGTSMPSGRVAAQEARSIDAGQAVRSVVISADGGIIVAGGAGGDILLFDGRTGKSLGTLKGHTKDVPCLSISQDGTRVASGSEDETAIVWDLAKQSKLTTHFCKHVSGVGSVSLSADGVKLATAGGALGEVKVWDAIKANPAATFGPIKTRTEQVVPVRCVALAPDGITVAAGLNDGTVRLWNVKTKEFQKTLLRHDFIVLALAFAPDGKTIASGSAGKDGAGAVKLWNAASGKEQATLTAEEMKDVESVAFSPDGKILATGSFDGAVRLWDVEAGKALATLKGHDRRVWSVAFSGDGKLIASGSEDRTIKLWDVTKAVK